jgi:hypothetical protein
MAISRLCLAVLAPRYRTWMVVAARCKIFYCSVEAAKLYKKLKWLCFNILTFCFMIE